MSPFLIKIPISFIEVRYPSHDGGLAVGVARVLMNTLTLLKLRQLLIGNKDVERLEDTISAGLFLFTSMSGGESILPNGKLRLGSSL